MCFGLFMLTTHWLVLIVWSTTTAPVVAFQLGRWHGSQHFKLYYPLAQDPSSAGFGTEYSSGCYSRLCAVTSPTKQGDGMVAYEPDQVQGIIFDVDGTLANSWKLGYDATLVVLAKHQIPAITEEVYHAHTRYATPERLARHAGLMPGDAEFESTGKHLGDEFDDLYVGLVSLETASFFPGMLDLIHNIPSDILLGALTNAAARYAHALLQVNDRRDNDTGRSCSGIYGRFRSIRGADNVPKPKPHPDGLIQVCQEMGISPRHCVYIGDSPSDAQAAQAAGMPSIGVLWGSHNEESLRHAPFAHICRSVQELQRMIPQTEKI